MLIQCKDRRMDVQNIAEIDEVSSAIDQVELKKAQARLRNIEACKRHYATHKEYHRQYYAKNKESIQAKRRETYARERAALKMIKANGGGLPQITQ